MRDGRWRLCLAGAGHVGAGLLAMLRDREEDLLARYGVRLSVVGVAELGGAACDPTGLDLNDLISALAERKPLAGLPEVGRPGMAAVDLLRECEPDILCGATPVNLTDGQPGLGLAETALSMGAHVVLADKGPLALAFDRLAAASDLGAGWGLGGGRPALRFSATVAGALPVVNLGHRDLAGEEITRIEGVFNGTTQYVLRGMEDGAGFDEALADAQHRGIAEADPTLDIDGHDAAFKLLITANTVLGTGATVDDVTIGSIRSVTAEMIKEARGSGQRIVPLAVAERTADGHRLQVGPQALGEDHPLAKLHPDEMGVVFYAGRVRQLSAASLEPHPEPASAAMLRDVLDIVRTRTGGAQ